MSWYLQIRNYLGKFANLPEVQENIVLDIIKNVCNTHKVSFLAPKPTEINFVLYESVSQLFLILSTQYTDKYQLPIAIGLQVDKGKISANFIELSEQWAKKAEAEKINLDSSMQVTRVDRDIFDDSTPVLKAPVLAMTTMLNGKTRISWDLEDSGYFSKYELYINGTLVDEEFTNRYLTYYDTNETISTIELRKYSDDLYSMAEVQL